jgi:hypothetical protein
MRAFLPSSGNFRCITFEWHVDFDVTAQAHLFELRVEAGGDGARYSFAKRGGVLGLRRGID